MTHLGWFFAGTSLGLFVGVLLTFLARIEDALRDRRHFSRTDQKHRAPLSFVRR